MNDTAQSRRPSLVVVTGRPASGKSTLSHALARAVRCPAVCRDEIKEGYVHAAGPDEADPDANRHVYAAFFETVELLLRRRVTLVAEAAFQHKLWAPKLEPLRDLADIRIVVCTVDTELARSRFAERGAADPARERFHEGREFPSSDYDPPHLDVPTLTVDTSDGYRPAFEQIVAFARGALT